MFLAVILALALAAPASAVEFTDVEDTDFEPSITALAYWEFMGGYPDNTFRPDNPLQRQQFAKMAVLTMGYEVTAADVSTFADTPSPYDPVNQPLYPGSYAAVAAENQIMLGKPGNMFDFGGNVTRQQVITVVVRAAGAALAAPPAEWQGDLSYGDPTHGANIKKAEYNGLLAGIPDLATWDTTANATRGEAAELLAQLFYRTGEILTLVGPAGTQEFTMAELKALAATEGFGGWKNKVGNITGPKEYRGVSLAALIALAGGGTKVIATACDGYAVTYENGKLEGELLMYDPTTGETIFDPAVDTDIPAAVGAVTTTLLYECDGEALFSDEAPLRIGFLSAAATQISHSGSWAKQLVKITVE
jgi:hypothetical protein